jgi:uncharacterized C2H2 Zn-finger protein
MNNTVKCGICDEEIKQGSLYGHMKDEHSVSTIRYNCDTCNMLFKNNKIYDKHLTCESHLKKEKSKNINAEEIKNKSNDHVQLKVENIINYVKMVKKARIKLYVEHVILNIKHNVNWINIIRHFILIINYIYVMCAINIQVNTGID